MFFQLKRVCTLALDICVCSKRRLSIFWYSYPIGLAQWLACPPLTGRSLVRILAGSYQRPSSKWYKLPPFMTRNALGLEFDSAVRLSKRPGSVWNCLWGNALKDLLGSIVRVGYCFYLVLHGLRCRKSLKMD